MEWQRGPAQGNDPVERSEVLVGDKFLVLVECYDRHCLKRTYWYACVIVATEVGWDDANGESWGAWSWSDVEWFIKLDKSNLPPLDGIAITKKGTDQ